MAYAALLGADPEPSRRAAAERVEYVTRFVAAIDKWPSPQGLGRGTANR